jgi:hypothetical protein
MKHELLEEKLMQMLLAGDNEVLAKLRKQYEQAEMCQESLQVLDFILYIP